MEATPTQPEPAPTGYNPNEDEAFETRVAEDWLNKQRTLVVLSRNARNTERQLARELSRIMCHTKTDSVLDKGDTFVQLHELCKVKNCSNCLYIEQKKGEVYLWIAKFPDGPSLKFRLTDIVLSESFKFHGNCLRGSRPILSFDSEFLKSEELTLIKNMLVDCFNIPKNHPKSQPFFDKVFSFSTHEGSIHYRNYQIVKKGARNLDIEFTEIGPRFRLEPAKILDGFFNGKVVFQNEGFQKLADIKEFKMQQTEAKIQSKKIKKIRKAKKAKPQKNVGPKTAHEELLGE